MIAASERYCLTRNQNLKGEVWIVSPRKRLTLGAWEDHMADILVVDDDDVIRDTLCELLSAKYSCHTADTAEQALEKLEAQRFDVVLTDVSMPGLSGRELLNRVVELYPSTPVIIVSGLGD